MFAFQGYGTQGQGPLLNACKMKCKSGPYENVYVHKNCIIMSERVCFCFRFISFLCSFLLSISLLFLNTERLYSACVKIARATRLVCTQKASKHYCRNLLNMWHLPHHASRLVAVQGRWDEEKRRYDGVKWSIRQRIFRLVRGGSQPLPGMMPMMLSTQSAGHDAHDAFDSICRA